ncbi:LysR family transcriptional regulator [Amycolatopsis sp. cmx-8-4]|uniref:LysR family transcriptional regulator n=1 Tax=Amycolatopsis sp. cmx-8-4 TaxID=2790947 RepID=UPI00397D2A72
MHLDLNLLVALDVLLDEGSVGAAADRLHLSQPAMSRTLGRIRRATGDEILVRAGRVMLPTPYAERIRDEVHQLVTRAQTIFTAGTDLDLATLDRTFTLQCNDVVAGALVPRLIARVAATAPGVCLRVLGEADTDADGLRRGTVDVRLTDETTHPADVRSATVLTDTLVTAGRHDLAADPATTAGFTALPHVVVSRRGRRRDRIDDVLEAHGTARRVSLIVPTLAMALAAVTTAELVTVVPGMAAARLGPELRGWPLPVPTPEIPAVLAWHARHDRDGAHTWLRDTIRDVLSVGGPR